MMLLLFKGLGFFRLFDSTSFYLSLTKNTIIGTRQFLSLWLIAIFAFGLLPYFLNLVRVQTSFEDFVYSANSQQWTNSLNGATYSDDAF